ncbi:MAG TPA: hypothetical protein VGC32_21390 [Solirubrobacterales bacterium]
MNWLGYVVLAEGLVAQPFEASKRSGISRAYYGTLNVCRRWLEANVAPIGRHRVHAAVWGLFEAAGLASVRAREDWEAIAELGNSLRILRNSADYEDAFPELDRNATEAIGIARRILAALPELEPVG